MAAASSGGEADELIGEVARSEVNEMGDTMATASSGGEVSAPGVKRKGKRSKKSGDARRIEKREAANRQGNG